MKLLFYNKLLQTKNGQVPYSFTFSNRHINFSCSVWNSGIVHAIWNIVIIGGGLAIGEKMDPYSVMTYVLDSKVFAITGGEFGIESSVISLIGYIIVAGIAFIMIKSNRKN